MAVNTYTTQEERSQIYNPASNLRKLEKEGKTKPKASKRKEIIKFRVAINERETRK